MREAEENVKAALADSVNPAVLCSFGKDSILLLDLVLEQRPNTPVIWFRTGVDEKYAQEVIRDRDLMVFSWSPATVYLVGGRANRCMVVEYGVNGYQIPVLIDLARGERCRADKFRSRTTNVFLPFDTLLTGWKREDEHWLKGSVELALDGLQIGRAIMKAPLKHMTDEAVRSAIIDRKIPFTPTADELPVCEHCLEGSPCVDLPLATSVEFRDRFGLEDA